MANSASQSITGSKTLRNKKVQGTGVAGSTSLAKQSANAASLNQKKYGVPPTNGNQAASLTQGSKTAPNLASKVGVPNMGDMQRVMVIDKKKHPPVEFSFGKRSSTNGEKGSQAHLRQDQGKIPQAVKAPQL